MELDMEFHFSSMTAEGISAFRKAVARDAGSQVAYMRRLRLVVAVESQEWKQEWMVAYLSCQRFRTWFMVVQWQEVRMLSQSLGWRWLHRGQM